MKSESAAWVPTPGQVIVLRGERPVQGHVVVGARLDGEGNPLALCVRCGKERPGASRRTRICKSCAAIEREHGDRDMSETCKDEREGRPIGSGGFALETIPRTYVQQISSALSERCPVCSAEPDARCTNLDGSPKRVNAGSHRARIRLAVRSRAESEGTGAGVLPDEDQPSRAADSRWWRNHANCRDVDPEVMQPEHATPDQVEQAASVCRGCPVFAQCDAERRAQLYPFGMWAGQWFGDLPVARAAACGDCGKELPPNPWKGRPRQWCNSTCRKRALRKRREAEAQQAVSA